MEFRWLTREEQGSRAVDSSSLSEVLALAQRLQGESAGLVTEEQLVEMGRELGVQPEYVREAIRLRHGAVQPGSARPPEPPPGAEHGPIAAAAQALVVMGALLLLPSLSQAFTRSGRDPSWAFLALVAAVVAGWTARYPRLAGIAGAAAVPMIYFVSSFYRYFPHPVGNRGAALFFAVLSLGPLCTVAGRAAAGTRRWLERFTHPQRAAIPGH